MADDVAARFERALQHKINGEYDEAEALFKAVLQEQPDNADAHHELGLTYSFRVYIDESIEELEAAVRLSPNSIPYLMSLGKTHTMYGDYDKAKPIFQRVLQMDPFNDDAQMQLDFIG
jgi:tetratricopeptide (TPR) repeat protein